ncbi:MAG: chloramphenicol phosphotransferase CPT family protein [Defluviitaleaceae bacterium]|nr:chloramphenicol phosphotransferase CPT family protein [Defluviitaleaceae bacterium]
MKKIYIFGGIIISKGKIVFLNGVSSSGKTTIAKTLQKKLAEPYCWLSVDNFIHTMGERFSGDEFVEFMKAGGFKWILKAIEAFHRSIKVFSDAGLNVIADHVLQEPSWLDECLDLLQDNEILFVHVTCPVEELRRREKERGDRPVGQGESQLAMLNPKNGIYDVVIDTFNSSTDECTDEIIRLLEQPESFKAFGMLREKRT